GGAMQSGSVSDEARREARTHRVLVLLAVQVALLLAAVLLPIGFDRSSRLGLDFGHLLLLLALYALVWVRGLWLAFGLRRFGLAFVQLALPASFVVLALPAVLGS
ncbi:MAG TPA: hypothetical protein VF530_10455, partial [Planctomycetota bacterium]